MPLVMDISVYRDRDQCLSRQTLMSIAIDIGIHRPKHLCPTEEKTDFLINGAFLSEKEAYPSAFYAGRFYFGSKAQGRQ